MTEARKHDLFRRIDDCKYKAQATQDSGMKNFYLGMIKQYENELKKDSVEKKTSVPEKFTIGDKVQHKIFGEGIVTKVYLLYCEVQFKSLNTERNIQKDFLVNLSK